MARKLPGRAIQAGTITANAFVANISVGGVSQVYDVTATGTGYFDLPNGTTAERPVSAPLGALRYNTTTGFAEVYTSAGWGSFGAQPPSISTVTPASYNGEQGTLFTINGANFTADAVVKFVDVNNVEYTAGTVAFVNQSTLTATTPQDFTVAQEPLDVKVIQASGQVTKLDCIDCGGTPTWSTAAGLLATVNDSYGNYSPIATVTATDPDAGASITYSVISGSLPDGTSFNSTNGQISGDPNNVVSQTTSNFTIRASDNAGNTSDRAFSIIVNPTIDGSSVDRAATGPVALANLGINTNGLYYLNIGDGRGVVQYYCVFDRAGGPWVMVAQRMTSQTGDLATFGIQNTGTPSNGSLYNTTTHFNTNLAGNSIAVTGYMVMNDLGAYVYFNWTSGIRTAWYGELLDTGGETSNSNNAWTMVGATTGAVYSSISTLVNSWTNTNTVIELHHGGWNSTSGLNYIIEVGPSSRTPGTGGSSAYYGITSQGTAIMYGNGSQSNGSHDYHFIKI